MKKVFFSLSLILALLVSLAPVSLAKGDGDIRWFEHGLPNGLANDLLEYSGGYSPVYLAEQNWFSAAAETGDADYFPLVDIETGRDMGFYDVYPIGDVLRFSDEDEEHYGLLGMDGKVIVDAGYDYIYYSSNYNCIVGETEDGEDYFALDGVKLPGEPYPPEGLYHYYDSNNHLWGLEDERGNVVIPAQYNEIWGFVGGVASVLDTSGKRALINTEGEALTDFIYTAIQLVVYPEALEPHPENTPIPVSIGGKWGFINHDGTKLTDVIYDDAGPFTEGLAAVKVEDKWGYIDTTGSFVIDPVFEVYSAGYFCRGIAVMRESYGNFFIIDRTGRTIVSEDKYEFSEYDVLFGLAIAESEDGKVLLNNKGEEVFSRPYEYMEFINYDLPDYGRWILISDGQRFGIYENPNFPSQGDASAQGGSSGGWSFLLWAIPLCVVLAALITAAVVLIARKKPAPASAEASVPTGRDPAKKFCPDCGAKLSPDNKFCPKCGHKL